MFNNQEIEMTQLRILDLETGQLTQYSKLELTPRNAAIVILHKTMKNEGFEKSQKVEYMDSWVDHLNEINEEGLGYNLGNVSDEIASHLIYGTGTHIIGEGNKEVSNSFRDEAYKELVKMLEQAAKVWIG
jgi:hypothetical protein